MKKLGIFLTESTSEAVEFERAMVSFLVKETSVTCQFFYCDKIKDVCSNVDVKKVMENNTTELKQKVNGYSKLTEKWSTKKINMKSVFKCMLVALYRLLLKIVPRKYYASTKNIVIGIIICYRRYFKNTGKKQFDCIYSELRSIDNVLSIAPAVNSTGTLKSIYQIKQERVINVIILCYQSTPVSSLKASHKDESSALLYNLAMTLWVADTLIVASSKAVSELTQFANRYRIPLPKIVHLPFSNGDNFWQQVLDQ